MQKDRIPPCKKMCKFYTTASFISLNIQRKMAMFRSKMVNSCEIGNQTYRFMNPMFSKIKNSRYIKAFRTVILDWTYEYSVA
jgi:hypothetical protein